VTELRGVLIPRLDRRPVLSPPIPNDLPRQRETTVHGSTTLMEYAWPESTRWIHRSRGAYLRSLYICSGPSYSSGPIVLCLYACTSSPRLLDPTITTATTRTDLETSPAQLLVQLIFRAVLVDFSKSISFIIFIFLLQYCGLGTFLTGREKSLRPRSHLSRLHTYFFTSKSLAQAKPSQHHVRLHTSRVSVRTRSIYSESLVYQL
jgi:hypothetical protein